MTQLYFTFWLAVVVVSTLAMLRIDYTLRKQIKLLERIEKLLAPPVQLNEPTLKELADRLLYNHPQSNVDLSRQDRG